ncbi:ArgP/LysG family DNA-binding transcriptional regulator [Arthrobacter oryzae]|jgi:LysR family transcriptional regulator (chromosome initiation inhibitor)|uniref:ArgP/LysG family DNA-binding transcriptional regulator n=1 Tax=Arthrobacter oryzae TaxID=409290 RepID=UPI00277EF2E6|nr:ArgP/LysG family DNA-binding transcriptional regulator [Arthrobacter oryzae]MDQ0076401.1 LysR family transcriptional regulator (chromosome initiation inhibitor) [Arthrobacter oryzae]
MIDIHPDQARTLAAIVAKGSFDGAASHLSVTASAVSQRIRALEVAVGRPVLRRTRPIELTESGQAVVRFARQLEMLSADLADELQPGNRHQDARLTLVINSDSLHTWALAGLAAAAGTVQLEILREDQDYSLELLRSGAAAAAITATAKPTPGCTSRRLGVMRYLPVCTPAFAATWFGGGATAESLAKAPVIIFDRKDDLQDRYLRRFSRKPLQPPRHYVPAAHEFGEAIRLGMGWGLLPEIEIGEDLDQRTLQTMAARSFVDVPLHWQQWRYGSTLLDGVAAAIQDAARVLR